MLVKSSFEHFINYIISFEMGSAIILSSDDNGFMLLLLSKNKSEKWFQYLVYYYIIHTCNTKDNRYIAISTSDIYDIIFNVKRK